MDCAGPNDYTNIRSLQARVSEIPLVLGRSTVFFLRLLFQEHVLHLKVHG